jgi:hypothetical protein
LTRNQAQEVKLMKKAFLAVIVMVTAMCSPARAGETGNSNDQGTTIVRNGNSVAIVTQSGDPSKAEVHVEKQPGRTTIYRRSGGNTTIVTQSTNSADIKPEDLPPWIRKYLER